MWGTKYVLEELLRTGSEFGGEQSGHLIFPDLSLAGDGMITTLMVLKAMCEEDVTLEQLTAGFKRYPQVLINVRVREKRPFSEMDRVNDLANEVKAQLGDTGRLLLRYSGTESLARIMVEGSSQSDVEKFATDLADIIRSTIGE